MTQLVPGATYKPLSYVDTLPRRVPRKAVVVHTNGGGPDLHPWFEQEYRRTGDRICSHLQVFNDGSVEQYVPLERVAYAAYSASNWAVQIETEDDGNPARPWTPAQVNAIARILAFLDVPALMLAASPNPADGVGYHEQHAEWNRSGHACPGKGREAQLRGPVLERLAATKHPAPHVRHNPWPAPRRVIRLTDPLMHGDDVRWVQWAVCTLAATDIDGKYGKHTKSAVQLFQRHHHDHDGQPLDADGVVGPNTRWALARVTR